MQHNLQPSERDENQAKGKEDECDDTSSGQVDHLRYGLVELYELLFVPYLDVERQQEVCEYV